MSSVYVTQLDINAARVARAVVVAERSRVARRIRTVRRDLRAGAALLAGSHCEFVRKLAHGKACYKLVTKAEQQFLAKVRNPSNAAGYAVAWETVRRMEAGGVSLDHLPCGADDHAYLLAQQRYAYALSIVRDNGGRPIP